MLRAVLWPTLLAPTPKAGPPMIVACEKAGTDSDDALTLGEMTAMLEEMLSCYSTTEEIAALRIGLLGTRLEALSIDRVRVGPSTIPGAGLGVFATRALEEGELITLYPGDGLLHFSDGAPDDETGTDDKVSVSFGSHVPLDRRRSQTRSVAALTDARAYELPATSMMSLVGDPTIVEDAAYLGHMVNDVAACRSTSELAAYALATAERVNSAHKPLLGCHFASVTTRRVEAGGELFVSYGPGYWLSRQGGISTAEIIAAEEALALEIQSGGALCIALRSALEMQPGSGAVMGAGSRASSAASGGSSSGLPAGSKKNNKRRRSKPEA